MKKYDSYKNSGIEWIGDIPSHWEVKKIKHVAKINPTKNLSYKDYENEVVFLPMEKVKEDGHFEDDATKPVSELWNSYTYFEKGDIILAKITPCFENGKGALLSNLKTDFGFGSTEFHVIRADDADPNFLFYVSRSHLFMTIGEAFMTGAAGQKRVPSDFVSEFLFSLPSTNEQTVIANYLDLKTSEIDQIIADKKRLLELYEEEKTTIINKAVTKGVNPDATMKDSGIEWLGEIPEHWEVSYLKKISSIVLGKMLTSIDKGDYNLKPYLRAANLNWKNVNVEDVKEMWFSDEELKKYRLKRNDLLVSEGGEVGRTCIWKEELDECYIQNSVHKVTFNEGHEPEYYLQLFYLYGKIGAFDSIVNRISIAHLTVEKLRAVEFLVPPFEEQRSIVQHIESECSKIDFKKARTEELIDLLTEYRAALISEAVTGKIKVIED